MGVAVAGVANARCRVPGPVGVDDGRRVAAFVAEHQDFGGSEATQSRRRLALKLAKGHANGRIIVAPNAGPNRSRLSRSVAACRRVGSSLGAGADDVIREGRSPSPDRAHIGDAQHGYWLVGSDGGVFSFGAAQFYGSVANLQLQSPVIGIASTADRGGYWLVASDGGVFAFGDAGFYGSIPGLGLSPVDSPVPHSLNAAIVGIVPSSDGRGYFLVANDGGVFALGMPSSMARAQESESASAVALPP